MPCTTRSDRKMTESISVRFASPKTVRRESRVRDCPDWVLRRCRRSSSRPRFMRIRSRNHDSLFIGRSQAPDTMRLPENARHAVAANPIKTGDRRCSSRSQKSSNNSFVHFTACIQRFLAGMVLPLAEFSFGVASVFPLAGSNTKVPAIDCSAPRLVFADSAVVHSTRTDSAIRQGSQPALCGHVVIET